ncbi:DCC1-like thiol-disulfide oxidoreductase family protein [Psychroserpens ponticola]|uniref:DCC1-like thiol-disulfide oxidoreductase family protein n=1 Tax=Psychroserpens ponticola TaxID=2932268 RepID=A0ABY7RZF4_9FLAO|nr:DCC1-like thiol-disulfide oxidoreductase family protein [Psychroserpens ponticola]WCO02514.1 DCC1-like thiol-disulfide oxidoreductase family protein [Psychroserpens ponticola]
MSFISKLYDKKISSKGLGVFRILFSSVFLLEVIRIFKFRQLYFDPIPFIQTSALSEEVPFVIWMIALFMLVIGAFTRVAALINYIFILIYISSIGVFEYHMDYTYTGVSFMFIFLSVSKSYSFDRLAEKLKFSNLTYVHQPKESTSVINYWLVLFVGIGLVYLDSVFFKLNSKIWTSGLGMWYPASLPQMTIFNNQWLLNQEFLIKFLGYLTFAFEIVFPFLFWMKKLRIPLLIIGIGLHLGILIEFPIPYFGLGVIAVYVLLIPNHLWKRLERKIKAKKPNLILFYDAECPLCMKTRIVLSFFDVFNTLEFNSVQESFDNHDCLRDFSKEELLNNIHAVNRKGNVYSGIETYKKAFLIVPMFFVFGVLLYIPGLSHIAKKIYNYIAKNRKVERCTAENCGFLPAPQKTDTEMLMLLHNFKLKDLKIVTLKLFVVGIIMLQILVNFKQPFSNDLANAIHNKISNASSKLLGVTEHGVFMDGHYKDYNKIFTISYNDELLPFYHKNGMPDYYIRGGSWVNFSFRVNKGGRDANHIELRKGLERYVAFWAYKNSVGLDNTTFKLLRKDIDLPSGWKLNSLQDNLKTPWVEVGKMTWKNSQATFQLLK